MKVMVLGITVAVEVTLAMEEVVEVEKVSHYRVRGWRWRNRKG